MSQTAQQVLEEALARGIPISVGGDEMMSLAATCIFFGGDKPINPSTLYRGIKRGVYPSPVRQGSRMSRWLRSECEAARQKLIVARNQAEAA
jgi:hypothetical protein